MKSAYEYDAFGNRTSLVEDAAKTSYTYDILDRLVEAKELNADQIIVKTYEYDKRGNQTKEYVDGLLQKTFTFDATNMLSKVVDKTKGELENHYNGLGFRVASNRPEEKIEYLCDLSRDYYNLLERTINGETESFIYDSNVVSMSKAGRNYYYLQDELGSPMYMTGTDGMTVSTYAFDDFGRNIDPLTGKQRNHDYATNGNIIQPFAFTGYQEDEVSGLKFAQARFYDAKTGRFQSEDNVKGFIDSPFTQNHYGYCYGNPLGLADTDGNMPDWVTDAADKIVSSVARVVHKFYGETKTWVINEGGDTESIITRHFGGDFLVKNIPDSDKDNVTYTLNVIVPIPYTSANMTTSLTLGKDLNDCKASVSGLIKEEKKTDSISTSQKMTGGYVASINGLKEYTAISTDLSQEGLEKYGMKFLPDHEYEYVIKHSKDKKMSKGQKIAVASGAIIAGAIATIAIIADNSVGIVGDEAALPATLGMIEESGSYLASEIAPYWLSILEIIKQQFQNGVLPSCSGY